MVGPGGQGSPLSSCLEPCSLPTLEEHHGNVSPNREPLQENMRLLEIYDKARTAQQKRKRARE
jgi:hypothetical protein